MEKDFKFAVEDIQKIDISEYEDDEFAVAKMGYLSTKPNSHGLKISEEVLRKDAKTVLNKWLVADMTSVVDAGTHTKEEKIVGRIPKEQKVEFIYDKDGYLRAYADVVISKIYAKDFCKIFEEDNNRAVSVEMRVISDKDDEDLVESFKIVGVTTLGKSVRPSCPDSDITFTRFSEQEADKFFAKVHNNSLTALKKFVEERKESMAEKENFVSHPIDTSKEAIYEGEWDGQKAKQDLVKEKNFKTLAPKVCMKLESGWEDREVTKLGYPVMMLHDGKWVYSTKGLASALGYAKKENETAVINKVEKIYEKLGLGKEEEAKMAENTTNFEIEGRKAWGEIIKKVQEHEGDGAYVDSVEKDHIIYTKDDIRYRVEADVKVGKDDDTVEADIKWDTVKKDADQKMSDDCDCNEEEKNDCNEEDFMKKCAELEKDIEERDNIIMEKDKKMGEMEKELSELREFKKTCMEKEKMSAIESIMSEVKEFMSEEKYKELREEGIACDFAQIDAWSNKVKAFCFESGKKSTKKDMGVFSFAAPVYENEQKKSRSVWERL